MAPRLGWVPLVLEVLFPSLTRSPFFLLSLIPLAPQEDFRNKVEDYIKRYAR